MGGKKKGAAAQPRIKDNMKPSSSDKAAQFLIQQTGGLGLPSSLFSADFSTIPVGTLSAERPELIAPTKVPGLIPVPQDPDASALEPRLLSTLKRLEKRDVTTKQKALKELIDLLAFTGSDSDNPLDTSAVIAILPFWPRIYCKLAVDENRKVRELVQSAMGRIAQRVGRELGPYIKQIFPLWAFSTVDVHEPAGTLANQGIRTTFPGTKRLDAYRACARQILDLVDNKMNEELDLSSVASALDSTSPKVKGNKDKRTIESKAQNVPSDSSALQLTACLRFITSLVEDFAHLPVDNPQLLRFRKFLAPGNFWNTISRYIHQHILQKTSSDGRCLVGYSPAVHSAVYRLSTALCSQASWNIWLQEMEDGRELANYLCASIVARLGPVDSIVKPTVNQPPCLIPAPLMVAIPGSGCYTQAWEAALAILTHLPASLVWSVIDWRVDVCMPLEKLLHDVGMAYTKQVYPNLLCLLSRLPLDYGHLSTEDKNWLETLFVDAALKGLERIIIPRTVPTNSSPEPAASINTTQVSVDPSVSVTVVTGLLECARFLVDRITTASDTESNPDPLALRILDHVVLRLFADSLHVVHPDDVDHIYLVCSHPPLIRQAFLEAVFCQVSALFTNLARAPESSFKATLFTHMRTELLRWVSMVPLHNNAPPVSASIPVENLTYHTHLGLLDSLRLTQFADCLAQVVTNQNSSTPGLNRLNRTELRARVANYQPKPESITVPTDPIVIQDAWCINLFVEICQQIEAQLSSVSADPLVETSFYIAYLCVSGYLPDITPVQLPDLEHKLFSVILPTLSDDLLPLFWTDSAVRGLVRSWCGTLEASNPADRLCALSRHRFLIAILPILIHMLPTDSVLSQHVCDLCLEWARDWAQNVLSDDIRSNPLSLSDLANLLSLFYNDTASVHHSFVTKVGCLLLPTILVCVQKHLPSTELSALSGIQATLLRNMATLCLTALEETCPAGKVPMMEEINVQIKDLLIILLRLLFSLYLVHHFACVGSTIEPQCELVALLTGPSATVHSVDAQDVAPVAHSLLQLPLAALIAQIEQVFLTPSALTKSWPVETYFRLILHTVIHIAYVPAQMIRFLELFMGQYIDRLDTGTDRTFHDLWLSTASEAMLAVVDTVSEYGSITGHDDCPPPRPILFPAGLLPINVSLPLGRLFRAWQFVSQLRLINWSSDHVNSDRWRRYIYCLGVLRGCISSLAEPFDPCTTFGWPSPFCTLQQPVDNQSQNPNILTADGYLEPARSAFAQWELSVTTQIGLSWHTATSDVSLSTLHELLSWPTIKRLFPQLQRVQLATLCSILNAVCLNRVRSVHPNYWHRNLKLAASCTDDPANPSASWLDDHVRSRSNPNSDIEFNRLCELEMPAGIVRRCLPRQELLGRLKCLSMMDSPLDEAADDSVREPPDAHRVLQLLTSLISVHNVSPVYATTFLTILTNDYQKWLTQLADASGSHGSSCLMQNESGLRATLASMGFLESLLLLWQPWQWYLDVAGKSTVVHHLGLIQLSMRLKQLRPLLTRNEWDLILCLIISWVCFVAEQMDEQKPRSSHRSIDVLATRAFRVAAAVGAVFVERTHGPVPLDSLILSSAKISKGDAGKSYPDEWEEDLDGEVIDSYDENTTDDQGSLDEDEGDKPAKSQAVDGGLLSEFEEDQDALTEDEQFWATMDEDLNDDTETLSWNSVQNLIPRKGQPPVQIREDWEKFFSNHLYSTLLPILFRICFPVGPDKSAVVSITPRSLQSLCAAFATCSMPQLLRLLTAQPHLILEYLVDLDRVNVSGAQLRIKQLIPKRSDSTDELTTGLRACFDFGAKLIRCSPIQSGQLLGHVVLSRILCARTRPTGSNSTLYLSNYILHRLPTSWLLGLYGSFPHRLEQDLTSERALTNWGRGGSVLTYLLGFSVQEGWFLDVQAHHQLLSYLLSWDCLLTMLTSAGPQARARLQQALLGPSAALFDRLLLCLGLLLPPPGNLETLVANPCRLEPDERLLLPVSASRTDLIAAMSLRSVTRQRLRRPMRLAVPVASGDDREWRDPFSPDDRLLYLPGNRLASDISHMAVRLLRRFLAEAPALMRGWIARLAAPTGITEESNPIQAPNPPSIDSVSSSANELFSPLCGQRPGRLRQLASLVDKLISRHFSPGLARDEVLLVQYKAQLRELKRAGDNGSGARGSWFSILTGGGPTEVGKVSIRGRPLSREVIATYQVTDEHSMEMLIQLPANYPLGLVTVSCGRGVGISQQQWHMWTVQLSVFINNQNGSILDGIDLWQKNVRKKFEGVEECAICYSIVHNTNFSLPKMQCHTCRKLFHYACMYRWFTTSRNPACPLCRHLFFGPTGRPTT